MEQLPYYTIVPDEVAESLTGSPKYKNVQYSA